MDEELAIIDSKTRNEKIKNFFLQKKKLFFVLFTLILVLLLSYFAFNEYIDKRKIKISEKYNSIIIEFSKKNKQITIDKLIDIIKEKDPTYSPLSLYFLIDNSLISDHTEVNKLFDIVIDEISLDREIKNLIIYKKALYNADISDEIQLLKILKPLINSDSIWKSHGLYLAAEYFYSKDEKQKSKEFFSQILELENANQDLKIEAQKRLNRDLSD